MTSEERKKKKKELKSLFQPYFDSIGESNAYYIPKSMRKEGQVGAEYLAISFFDNELELISKMGHVYVELVDYRNMNRLADKNFKLFKWTYNPYWNDPSEGYEQIVINSQSGTYYKYAIPFEEFTVVGEGEDHWNSFKNEPEQLPLFDMSSISGVKPKHEPIDHSTAFGAADVPSDGLDTLLSNLTARDLYAIVHRKPISSIPEINQYINKENNN
jgi:hypothetical protein